MNPALKDALEQRLDISILKSQGLRGGEINDSYRIDLADGTRLFVKTHPQAPEGMYRDEAQGLQWLAQTKSLTTPAIIAFTDTQDTAHQFLVLEYLKSSSRQKSFDEDLGRGLAHMHRFGASCFGLDTPNYLATLVQNNSPCDTWAQFYAQRRLDAQLKIAMRKGAPLAWAAMFEKLYTRLDELVGDPEAPARLHGDLWGGNLHVGAQGEPCLIDPAVYGGHREIDLAMMRLFGGFSDKVFHSYHEAYPLQAEHHDRVGLYQLYPLMVHFNLFGGHYADSVTRSLRAYI
jgi:fructosamine-3-kinase